MTSSNTIVTQWGSKAVTFAALPGDKRKQRMQQCSELIERIKEKTDIDVFLVYGCLLGAVRSNRMIDHDFDIDLSFFVDSNDLTEILSKCRILI